MIKHLSLFFNSWSKPILFWIASIVLLMLCDVFENPILENICFIIFCLALFGLLISVFFQLSKREWLKSILTAFLFGGTMLILFITYVVAAFFIEQETPDTWAKNLTIPKNIPIDNPVDTKLGKEFENQKPDSITNRIVEQTEFQLYNSFQPGLYEYGFLDWENRKRKSLFKSF